MSTTEVHGPGHQWLLAAGPPPLGLVRGCSNLVTGHILFFLKSFFPHMVISPSLIIPATTPVGGASSPLGPWKSPVEGAGSLRSRDPCRLCRKEPQATDQERLPSAISDGASFPCVEPLKCWALFIVGLRVTLRHDIDIVGLKPRNSLRVSRGSEGEPSANCAGHTRGRSWLRPGGVALGAEGAWPAPGTPALCWTLRTQTWGALRRGLRLGYLTASGPNHFTDLVLYCESYLK